MEGFVHLRIRPWLRRLITRFLAIAPAVVIILLQGDSAVDPLLVLSQVILSLQLSFAVVPLIHFTSDRRRMGAFATPWWGRILAWASACIIGVLNLKLVAATIGQGWQTASPWVCWGLTPAAAALVPLLAWMVVEPLLRRRRPAAQAVSRPWLQIPEFARTIEPAGSGVFRRIGIALEDSPHDAEILAGIIPLVRAAGGEVVLIHVAESAVARYLGSAAEDAEMKEDRGYLRDVATSLLRLGVQARTRLGAGEAEDEIARIAREEQLDLIVTGSHGHRLLGDLFHGSTATELRHRTRIPVLTLRVGVPHGS